MNCRATLKIGQSSEILEVGGIRDLTKCQVWTIQVLWLAVCMSEFAGLPAKSQFKQILWANFA